MMDADVILYKYVKHRLDEVSRRQADLSKEPTGKTNAYYVALGEADVLNEIAGLMAAAMREVPR
jgi:hypothetical protein